MDFWWPKISADCILVVAHCDGCRIKKTKFVAESSLRPTDKPRALLEGWSIDLITNTEPVSLERYRHCIATFYCFTKWTELWQI